LGDAKADGGFVIVACPSVPGSPARLEAGPARL
jgi:hypothetical protein